MCSKFIDLCWTIVLVVHAWNKLVSRSIGCCDDFMFHRTSHTFTSHSSSHTQSYSHCEHHDFPTIPLHRLGELRKIAPEFYSTQSNDNVLKIMKKAFTKPEFYACMDANIYESTG